MGTKGQAIDGKSNAEVRGKQEQTLGCPAAQTG